VIAKHHGQITVASEVGCGSTFTIQLPLARDAGSAIDDLAS